MHHFTKLAKAYWGVKKGSHQKRFKGRVTGSKTAKKASKKIQTIAGRLVRDVSRKLLLATTWSASVRPEIIKTRFILCTNSI